MKTIGCILSRWGGRKKKGPIRLPPSITSLIVCYGFWKSICIPPQWHAAEVLVDLMPEVYGRNSEARLSRMLLRHGLTAEALDRSLRIGGRTRLCLSAQGQCILCAGISDGICSGRGCTFSALCLPGRSGAWPTKFPCLRKTAFTHKFWNLPLGIWGRASCIRQDCSAGRGSCELSRAACERYAEQSSHLAVVECKALAMRVGYMLGNTVYESYLAGNLSKTTLRQLFLKHLEQPGAAREICFSLVGSLHAERKKSRAAGAGHLTNSKLK